jgi:signal transduction histidine kinase
MANGNLPKYVHLTGIISEDSNQCYLTIVDITEKTLAEEEVRNMKKALEMLNHRFIKVSENERILISSEIHDQLGQSLVALNLDVHWLSKRIACDSEEGKKISGIIELLTSLMTDVQKISFEVRPLMLNDLGLCSTMECYCNDFEKRTGISCHLKIDEVNNLNENKSLTLFRILQEALTNVIRHSNAKNVNVNLSHCEDTITLEVIDDGIGFEKNKINSYKSLGFIGIRERIREYDGRMDIITNLNKGTTLSISLP